MLHFDEDLSALPQLQLSIPLLGHLHVHDRPRLARQFNFHQWPGRIDGANGGTKLGWLGRLMVKFQEVWTSIGYGRAGLWQTPQRQLQAECPEIQRAVLYASLEDIDMPEEVIHEWGRRVLVDLL